MGRFVISHAVQYLCFSYKHVHCSSFLSPPSSSSSSSSSSASALLPLFFSSNQLEQKMVNKVALLSANESRMLSQGEIKRSSSESDFDIEEFLSKAIVGPEDEDANKTDYVVGGAAYEFCNLTDERFQEFDVFVGDDCSAAPLKNREIKNAPMRCGRLSESLWSQSLTPKPSSISGTIDSQSSACVGSPASANQPARQIASANSRSSHEQSDDEDVEIELGPCEQSSDPVSLKRIKRKISNRNSARRSRQRKQAHLTELECQVVHLQEENASLYKHLTDASQEYRDANTNNRVLKSGVEALRAKVKLAEDMIARGPLANSPNHLLQNRLSKAAEPLNPLGTVSNVSPTINLQGDGVSFAGRMSSGHRLGGREMGNLVENMKSLVGSDDLSGLWP